MFKIHKRCTMFWLESFGSRTGTPFDTRWKTILQTYEISKIIITLLIIRFVSFLWKGVICGVILNRRDVEGSYMRDYVEKTFCIFKCISLRPFVSVIPLVNIQSPYFLFGFIHKPHVLNYGTLPSAVPYYNTGILFLLFILVCSLLFRMGKCYSFFNNDITNCCNITKYAFKLS